MVALVMLAMLAALASAQEHVSFPTTDGGVIQDVYGKGDRGVVLAHGGRFNKESWSKQARELAAAGFKVLAIDFRGYGQSRGPGQADIFSAPLHLDVLAGVRYLRKTGVKTVSLVGGSMGGGAAADAGTARPSTSGDARRRGLVHARVSRTSAHQRRSDVKQTAGREAWYRLYGEAALNVRFFSNLTQAGHASPESGPAVYRSLNCGQP